MQTASTQHSTVDRLFAWWYVIAAPAVPKGDVSPKVREHVRKGRFTSLMLLIEFLINIPSYFVSSDPHLLIPLTISMSILCVGMVLNRLGKTAAAGIIILVVMESSMYFWLTSFGFAPGGLSAFDLPFITILIQPVFIAVSLFNPKVSLPLGILNALFIACIIYFLPKTPELARYLSTPETGFSIYFVPIANLLFITVVSGLWVTSATQAMRRADQAEEVNRLMEALAHQQRIALEKKQQLEESIQQIVVVHVQAANGDLSARVPLDQKNVLWAVAGSLNNLLARLQGWRWEAQQRQRIEQAIQVVLRDIQQSERAGTALPMRRTGTALDPLIVEFARLNGRLFRGQNETPWPGQVRRSDHDSPSWLGPYA